MGRLVPGKRLEAFQLLLQNRKAAFRRFPATPGTLDDAGSQCRPVRFETDDQDGKPALFGLEPKPLALLQQQAGGIDTRRQTGFEYRARQLGETPIGLIGGLLAIDCVGIVGRRRKVE